MNRGGAVLIALSIGLTARVTLAEVSLQTQAPAKIEVGQRFNVQLTAMAGSGEDSPSQPKLPVPRNFVVQGPSVSTQYQVTTINGRFEQRQGVTATWLLMSNAVGRFRIGPASVISAGHSIADKVFFVEVVAAGTLQPQRNRNARRLPFDPFDPFGDFDPFSSPMLPQMRGLGQFAPNVPEPQISAWPHEFDIAQPRDPIAFLDARITPKRVVIGQQVTFSIFAYGHPGPFELSGINEPSLSDFLSYDLMEDGASREIPMRIGEDIWYAQKLRERALFPLHAGHLQIGAMRASFRGVDPAGQAAYKEGLRQSQLLNIVVVEPPISGRPSGYRLGDVGQFQLSSSVEPRDIKANDAVAVNFELSGTGNLPQHIDLPERSGIEWLEPNTNQAIERKNGKIAGKRVWQYVLRLHNAGTVELGTVRLPYYDPERGQYAFATTELGQIVVRPGAEAVEPTIPSTDDSLAHSIMPREQLGAIAPPQRYWAEMPHFFALLLLGPLGVIAGMGIKSLSAKGLIFWSRRRASVKRRTLEQLQVARDLLARDDAAGAATAIERALLTAIEAATGVKARGIIRNELGRSLNAAGLSPNESELTVSMLDACDAVRFTGGEKELLSEPLDGVEVFIQDLCRRAARGEKARAS